jgi:hypothetical protein
MAEASETTGAELQTSLGSLKLTGRDSLFLFLFLAILAHMALTIWSHLQRSKEHDSIECAVKLNTFMQTVPKGEAIDWSKVPVDIYQCIPRFLYERTPR